MNYHEIKEQRVFQQFKPDIKVHEPFKPRKSEPSGPKDTSSSWLQGLPNVGENKWEESPINQLVKSYKICRPQ